MSPVPTHWDPKHTDQKDGCNTVHCRHFNLALDSSRLIVIYYRSALQVPTLRLYAKDRRLCLRSLDTLPKVGKRVNPLVPGPRQVMYRAKRNESPSSTFRARDSPTRQRTARKGCVPLLRLTVRSLIRYN